MELIILYIVSVVASFWLFQNSWRYDFDMELSDCIFMGFLSLIPVANIFSAFIIWMFERPWISSRKIILKKYEND